MKGLLFTLQAVRRTLVQFAARQWPPSVRSIIAHLFLPSSPAGPFASCGSPVDQAQDAEREMFLYVSMSLSAVLFKTVVLRNGERPQDVRFVTMVDNCCMMSSVGGLLGIGIRLDTAQDELACETSVAPGL